MDVHTVASDSGGLAIFIRGAAPARRPILLAKGRGTRREGRQGRGAYRASHGGRRGSGAELAVRQGRGGAGLAAEGGKGGRHGSPAEGCREAPRASPAEGRGARRGGRKQAGEGRRVREEGGTSRQIWGWRGTMGKKGARLGDGEEWCQARQWRDDARREPWPSERRRPAAGASRPREG